MNIFKDCENDDVRFSFKWTKAILITELYTSKNKKKIIYLYNAFNESKLKHYEVIANI